ncbi:MAG: bifunctional helix-turn-helix transcriptional regulator/GNAT family N-acetyltransferase, partial [Myxococcota bacterium]
MELARLRAFRADSRTMVRELGFLQDDCRPAGLPHVQVHVLLELAAAGTLRPSDLAERLQSDPAVISRTLARLQEQELVASEPDPVDRRQRLVTLAPAGLATVERIQRAADAQVLDAVALLRPDEVDAVVAGMHAYARALHRARLQRDVTVRPITPADDPQVQTLIRTVMPEFGASGPGFAIHDPEVDAMSAAYAPPAARYWVIERQGRIVGGGGYAALVGGEPGVCELRKMYFLPELRGLGLGARLLRMALDGARDAGYRTCYLETLEHMSRARRLYEAFGFRRLGAPLGATGHHGCDAWYALDLAAGWERPMPDLLAPEVRAALEALGHSEAVTVVACDEALADTAAFCAHYGFPE